MSCLPFNKLHVSLMLAGFIATSTMAAVSPGEIFTENFDSTAGNDHPANKALLTTDYVSAAVNYAGNPLGQRYTASGKYDAADADPYWSSAKYCNGIWLNYGTANPNNGEATKQTCVGRSPGNEARAWNSLQLLANVLGQVSNPGSRPADNLKNYAIAAFTEAPDGAGLPEMTVLQSREQIPIPEGGRFVTFSVAAAAINCSQPAGSNINNEPQFMFKLVLPDSTELAVNNTALNPCVNSKEYSFANGLLPRQTDPAGRSIYAAQLVADKAHLVTADHIGLRFTNKNSRGYGNDGAFDNIVILDVSPHMAKSFLPDRISTGQTSTLTFTATNTTDLLEKTGWTFTDTLPYGMVVANPPNIVNHCGTSIVAAAAGANTIAVTNGNLPAQADSCTISVDVTAQAASPIPAGGQTFKNDFGSQPGAGIVTTTALVPTSGASLTVTPVADMVATPTPPENFALGVTGSIITTCVNQGPDVAAAATCVVSDAPAGALTVCTPASGSKDLLPAEYISCETTFKMDTAGTVTLKTKGGSNTADPNTGNNVQTVVVTATSPAVDLQADAPPSINATVGAPVNVTTTCKNNGPDAAANASCTVTGAPADATTVCTPSSPQSSLPANESMRCVTTFTPKTSDPLTLTTTAGTTTAEVNTRNNVAVTNVTLGSTPVSSASVPTLGEWAVLLLSSVLAGLGLMRLRRARIR